MNIMIIFLSFLIIILLPAHIDSLQEEKWTNNKVSDEVIGRMVRGEGKEAIGRWRKA